MHKVDFGEPEEARIELFCELCNKMEFGTEKEIYLIAQSYVEQFAINYYADLGESSKVKKMNIANVCNILSWALQNMGYCNKKGFVIPPQITEGLFGESVILDDGLIAQFEVENE